MFYDPVEKKLHISRDVVFHEAAEWDWSREADEDVPDRGDFSVEYSVVSCRRVPVEPVDDDRAESPVHSLVGALASPPAWEEEADVVPDSPEVEGVVMQDDLDADHDDAPLRLRSMRNIIGQVAVPGQAMRDLEQGELFAVSTNEPNTFADVERQSCWRAAMIE
jgi:hypothetical protein